MTAPLSAGPDPKVLDADYRVRFDEAGPDGLLRTSCFLRYAQDIAWLHSTALGFDRDWYRERGLTWLVRAAELEVLAPVPMGATVHARTIVVAQRRVVARRRGEFRLADGTPAAWINTDWVMIDGSGRLTRIPAVVTEVFQIPESMDPLARVALPPTPAGAAERSFAVRPQELDPMDHVNNAVYVDWLEAAIRDRDGAAELRTIPRRYRLEYAAAADAGAVLGEAVWRDGGRWSYRVTTAVGGDAFRAIVEAGGGDR
ncbi:MAG TPA: acyl-ACP thioesterase domain-containing protein [Candidatus Limnocylindrales bacterium]|nr:acyl-ACP thioesterase domain-containing protein [Candidatus Limnocylindrales bacterium]